MTHKELTDEIAQAISDSFDLDQTDEGEVARAVVANVPVVGAIPDFIFALYQYRSDLRRPPSADSIERRHAMIDALLAKAGAKFGVCA